MFVTTFVNQPICALRLPVTLDMFVVTFGRITPLAYPVEG
jgi:hypothetical protein